MIKCEKCEKEFKYKYLLIRHEKNKKSCDLPKKYVKKNTISKELDKKIKNINVNINNFDSDITDYNEDITNYDIDIEDIDNKIDKINNKISELYKKSIKKKTVCTFCNTIFLNKTNLLRHIKNSCIRNKELNTKINDFITEKNNIINKKTKIMDDINRINDQKKQLEQEKNKIMDQHKLKEKDDEIKKLREAMEKLIQKQVSPNISITNNNNKVINNNLIVNINNFGKEDLSHITLNDYKKYLSGFFPGFIKFIEKVHFDENAPENHNINITNIKSKYLHIYEDNKWTLKEKVDVIDKFINKKYTMLVDKCEELEEKNEISDKIIDDFVQFTQNYKDQEAQKNTKNKISTLIYNNRDKVSMK